MVIDSEAPLALDGKVVDAGGGTWKDELIAVLRALKSDGFERLAERLLREAGFLTVQVTGRSGDGGIDGIGVLRVNLLLFHVLFQCKRYQGSASAGAIRDFRGAMVARKRQGPLHHDWNVYAGCETGGDPRRGTGH